MKPCLSQSTTLPTGFVDDLDAYASAGITAIEVWLTKLENALRETSAEDLRSRITDRGVQLVAASYQGGLLLSQGDARRTHFEHFKQRLGLCEFFGIPTMLLAADFAGKVTSTDLERSIVSLAQAAQWASGFGVRLGLEFRGGDAFCSCVETAIQLVESCREPNVGVNLDLFHYFKGPSKFNDLRRLTPRSLAFVQVCDVAGVPRELMSDADRILPGEGDFELDPIVEHLRQTRYDGFVSLELMNPVLWQMRPAQVAEMGASALARLLAPAEAPGS